jgi:hypothetical protein
MKNYFKIYGSSKTKEGILQMYKRDARAFAKEYLRNNKTNLSMEDLVKRYMSAVNFLSK